MRPALLVAGGALLGVGWGNGPVFAAALLLPLLWQAAPGRWTAGAVAAAYYLVASRGLPVGAGIFFAASAPAWFGWCLWAVTAALNAGVWTLAWRRDPQRRALGAVAAVVVTALPPVGLVGWTNPITAAGLWFPGLGFIGLAFALGLVYFMALRRREALAIFAGAAVIANLCAVAWPKTEGQPADWRGYDTDLRQLQAGSVAGVTQRVQLVMDLAESLQAGQVAVLPETVLPAADPRLAFAGILVDEAAAKLRDKGAVVLVGTEVPLPGGKLRQNVLMPLGEESGPLVQRVPVPIGMWRPWSDESYTSDVAGSGVATVAGKRIAYSICYEQVLVFPILRSMLHRPALIVGAANDWWARSTSIPAIQAQALDAWGRLFGVPVVRATNI